MRYVIYRGIDGHGNTSVQVLERNGYEDNVPCYEHFQTCINYPDALRLISRITEGCGND